MDRLLIFGILLICLIPYVSAQSDMGEIQVGEGKPEFTIIHDDGNRLTIGNFLNKVLLIYFFTVDCDACHKELAAMEEYIWPEYKDYINFSLLVFGVEATDEELKEYNRKPDYPFPLYPDPDTDIFNLFALGEKPPRTYLVDIDNKVLFVSKEYSATQFTILANILEKLLNSTPVYDDPLKNEPHIEGIE